MPHAGRLAPVLVSSALALTVSEARGEAAVVELQGPTECGVALSELKTRVAALEEGLASDGRRASVVIEPSGAGYRVQLRTGRGGEISGETAVTAPTCEEATDAAAIVLALAARAETRATDDAAAPPTAPRPHELERPVLGPPRAKATPASTTATPKADSEPGPLLGTDGAAAGTRRLSLSVGVDAGTLAAPTLVATVGLGKSFGAVELRGALRYGLGAVDEEQETGITQSQRSEFGALEGVACYGTADTLEVAACGGAELGVVRSSRHVEHASGLDEDTDAMIPRLSGVLAARVAHRGGRIQPELECSGSGVALGREPGSRWLVVRVSAGAAVAF